MAPGSMPTNATEIFQEGIRIPAAQACASGGRVQRDAARDPAAERAHPRHVHGRPQRAGRRLHDRRAPRSRRLAGAYGDNQLIAIFDELLDRSEAMTREALRAIPRAPTAYVDYLDNDGIELDKRIRIEVAVTIGDGAMHVDFDRARARRCAARSTACRRAQPRRRLLRRARRHRSDDSRPTAAASARSRCTCRKAASSIRASPPPSTAAPRRSSASPAPSSARSREAVPERVPARLRRRAARHDVRRPARRRHARSSRAS